MSKSRIIHDLHDDFGVTISEAEKAYDIALEYIRLRSCGMGDHPEDFEPSEYVLVKASAELEEIVLHESCTDCPLYDRDRHRCPRFNKVIPEVLREIMAERRQDEQT